MSTNTNLESTEAELPSIVLRKKIESRSVGGIYSQDGNSWQRGKCIGAGGFGVVFLETCVEGSSEGQLRAVKHIRLQEKGLGIQECVRELENLATFSEDKYRQHFVHFYGWFKDEGDIGIAMEYCKHGDLGSYLQRATAKTLPEAEVCQVVRQLLEGLRLLHDAGFAHRDIKPQNILVVKFPPEHTVWHVKIADLGISKHIMASNINSTIVGTPEYMAPELKLRIDATRPAHLSTVELQQADIWAVGRVTQDLLLFSSRMSTLDQYRTIPAPPLSRKQGALDFVDRVMNDDPLLRLPARDAVRHNWLVESVEVNRPEDAMRPTHKLESTGERAKSWSSSASRPPTSSSLNISSVPSSLLPVEQARSDPRSLNSSRPLAVSAPIRPVQALGSDSRDLGISRAETAPSKTTNKTIDAFGASRRAHHRSIIEPKPIKKLPLIQPNLLGRIMPDALRRSIVTLNIQALGKRAQSTAWEDSADLVRELHFSPNGGFIMKLSVEKPCILDTFTGRPCFPGVPLSFSSDGALVATCTADACVLIYTVCDGGKIAELRSTYLHTARLTQKQGPWPSSFCPRNEFFAVFLPEQEKLVIWRLTTGDVINTIWTKDRHFAWTFSLSTGQLLVCSSSHWSNSMESPQTEGNAVSISFYNANTMQFSSSVMLRYDGGGTAYLRFLRFSVRSNVLAVAFNKGGERDSCVIKVFDVLNGSSMVMLRCDRPLRTLDACPSGNFVVHYESGNPDAVDLFPPGFEQVVPTNKRIWWMSKTGASGEESLSTRSLTIIKNTTTNAELPFFKSVGFWQRRKLRQEVKVVAWSSDGSKVAIRYRHNQLASSSGITHSDDILEIWDIGSL